MRFIPFRDSISWGSSPTVSTGGGGSPYDESLNTLANNATPSISGGNNWVTGGTTTITDFDDGVAGQTIRVLADHTVTITDGTNIFLEGSLDYIMHSGDTLILIQKADTFWYETGRSTTSYPIPAKLTVLDFGAVGDGTTDDYQAFQDAIDSNRVVYVPAADSAGNRLRYYIGTDTITYPVDGYYDPGPIGFEGLGGRPEIMLGHTNGAGFHLRYNRHMLKELQINSDGTRQAAVGSPAGSSDNVGVLIAGDDIPSGAGDRVHQGHVENVFVYNSPSDGFRIIGSVVSLYMLGCEVDEAGGHGFNIDNGEYVGYTNTDRPGQNVYILCRASDCGGHAIRMGGTISNQYVPYRQTWVNFECFRCATDPGIRDGNWNVSMFTENSTFRESAFGGEGSRQCIFIAGRNNTLENCRYINPPSSNAIRVGDTGGGMNTIDINILGGHLSTTGVSPGHTTTNLVSIEGGAKKVRVRFIEDTGLYTNLTSLTDISGNKSDIEGQDGTRERYGTFVTDNIGVGAYDGAGGDHVISIDNADTNPGSPPAAGGVMYVDTGSLEYIGAGGRTTRLAEGSFTIPNLANDATPSVDGRYTWDTGGSTTITDFDDGVEGQRILILANHTVTITHGTNIFLSGSIDYNMRSGDTLEVVQKADGFWYEIGRGHTVLDNRILHAIDFGARFDGSNDDSALIQAAIDHADSLGGGEVWFPKGTSIIGTSLIIPSKVVLRGEGRNITILRADNALNNPVIITEDFATLTGTNTWLTSAGVPYGFGFKGFAVDGNKANNSSGDGLQIYGKGYVIDDLLVYDCEDRGIYSECAHATGQTDETDMPEGQIGSLWVRNCDAIGFLFRGPHDMIMDQITVALNSSEGMKTETDGSTYGGLCYIRHIHAYSNGKAGLYFGSRVFANQIISEGNIQRGVTITGHNGSQIGTIQCFNNNTQLGSPADYPAVLLDATQCTIDQVQVTDENGGGGIVIDGIDNQISNVMLDGDGTSDAIALDITANNVAVLGGQIRSFNVAGGLGLRTGFGGAITQVYVNVHITDCDTEWTNSTTGSSNTYIVNGNNGFGDFEDGSGDGITYLRNRLTAPTTNPTTGGLIYAEGGSLQWRGSSGRVTRLAESTETVPNLANDATPSVSGRYTWDTGGTTTITDFDDGFEGQTLSIHAKHVVTITDGTNIFLDGSMDYNMQVGDSLQLIQRADGLWYEIGRATTSHLVPEFINVMRFGALGDGSTDDSAAIQAAIDFGGSNCTILFPSSTSDYILDSTITISDSNVTLLGQGTRLQVTHTAGAGIRFKNSNWSIKNMTVFAGGARASLSPVPGSPADTNYGIWAEADDNPSESVANGAIDNVQVSGHPNHNFLAVGTIEALTVSDSQFSSSSGGHGICISSGIETGRVNDSAPGQIMFLNCKANNNAGYGFKIGDIQDGTTELPYRVQLISIDTGGSATNSSLLHASEAGLYANNFVYGEQITVEGCGLGGAYTLASPDTHVDNRASIHCIGRDIQLNHNRYINCAHNAIIWGAPSVSPTALTSESLWVRGGRVITDSPDLDPMVLVESGATGVNIDMPYQANITSVIDTTVGGVDAMYRYFDELGFSRMDILAPNIYSAKITIDDDETATCTFSGSAPRGIMWAHGNSSSAYSFGVAFRVTSSVYCTPLGVSGVEAKPGRFSDSSSQDLTTTEATIVFDTEDFDPDFNYTRSSGEVTAAQGGYYMITANIPLQIDSVSGETEGAVRGFLQQDQGTDTWIDTGLYGQTYLRETGSPAVGGTGITVSGLVLLVDGEAVRTRTASLDGVDASTIAGEVTMSLHKVRDVDAQRVNYDTTAPGSPGVKQNQYMTVSSSSDGNLYLTNRTGGTKAYTLQFMTMGNGRFTGVSVP